MENRIIEEIKNLMNEANKNSENAACGYDEGWYNGEANAYEIVLKILKKG